MSPFFRFEQFEGWLGQGGMRNVKALPKTDNKIFEMDKRVTTTQLYRQALNVSGTFTLQAAGGFALERTIDIPCYQNKFEPFDTEGDRGDEEYKYRGDKEDKTETLKVDEVKEPLTDSIVRASGVDDYYIREKYKSLYAFIKHKKDYERVDVALEPESLSKHISALKSQQFMPDLESVEESAELFDEKPVKYIKRKSGIYATQDGGILIRDAWGNERRIAPYTSGWCCRDQWDRYFLILFSIFFTYPLLIEKFL